jgi:hypothetical protein
MPRFASELRKFLGRFLKFASRAAAPASKKPPLRYSTLYRLARQRAGTQTAAFAPPFLESEKVW